MAERTARELVASAKPGQEVIDQLEYVDALVARDAGGKLTNPPGLYVKYVHDDVLPPADFAFSRRRRLAEAARRRKQDEQTRAVKLKLDFEAFCVEETARFIADVMPPGERAALAYANRRQNRALLRHMEDAELEEVTLATVRSEVRHGGRVPLPTFEQFCRGRSHA